MEHWKVLLEGIVDGEIGGDIGRWGHWRGRGHWREWGYWRGQWNIGGGHLMETLEGDIAKYCD